MENIFSLTETKILSEESVTLSGDGMFFLYQIGGISEILCNGEQKTLSADEVFAGELQKDYSLRLTDGNESRAIFISACGELVKSLSELYGVKDGFSVKAPEALELFGELRLLPENAFFPETEKNSKAALVFHRLIYKLHKSLGTRLVRRTALRIKDYIDSHVEEKTELETLSGVFFMSKTQIHRLFKEEYGVAPIKYLTKCKIEASKKMLKNDNLKISEIAEALSFSDAKHFSKTFLKYEGILPSEYRKK